MWSSLIFGNYHYTQKFVETTEQLLHILDDTHLESRIASFSEIGIQEAKSDDLKPSENISESLKHPYMNASRRRDLRNTPPFQQALAPCHR